MSGHDQNEFQAMGWHLLKGTYLGRGCEFLLLPKVK